MLALRRIVLVAVLACPGSLLGSLAHADGPVTFSFVMPEMIDPNRVVTFTNINTQTLAGSDLTVPIALFPNTKGTEVHSAIPGVAANTIRDITSLQVQFHYNGTVNVSSQGSAMPGGPTYLPWLVSADQTGNLYTYIFSEGPNSAPINDNFNPGLNYPNNQSFATLTITGADADLFAFRQENPQGMPVTPITTGGMDRGPASVATPEFGSVFSLGGLLAAGAAGLWIRSRRRK